MLNPIAGQNAHYFGLACLMALSFAGCSTTSATTRKTRAPRGFIQINIAPKTARVYVDDTYQGEIKKWMHQTIPVAPGTRRIELKAAGYITQRFDLNVREGELLTLTLRLERQLDELKLPNKKTTRRKRRWIRPQ